jgi:hypothetical protein
MGYRERRTQHVMGFGDANEKKRAKETSQDWKLVTFARMRRLKGRTAGVIASRNRMVSTKICVHG